MLRYFCGMGVKRKTESLKTVLHTFEQTEEAISVVELVKKLKDQMNKTTVYRILERLEQDGVLHSFTDSNGLKWYAKCTSGCTTHHHSDVHPHFQCTDCGKVECLDFEVPLPSLPNRKVQSSEFLLVGQCEDCSTEA